MIADDDVTVAMELEELLTYSGYMISGIARSGEDAVNMASRSRPDMILMDVKMPGKLDGIGAAKEITSVQDIPVILVTGHAERDIFDRACREKIAGYVVKPFHYAQIIAAIEMGFRGFVMGTDVHPKKGDRPLDRPVSRAAFYYHEVSSDVMLTQMETRVVALIREGKRSQEVADILSLSKRTVDWHRGNIRQKLGLKKRSRY